MVLQVFRLASRRVGLPRLWSAVRSVARERPAPTDPARLARRVERLGRRLQQDGGCYPEALAAAALLAWHGHRPELVLGVRNGPPFEAHAWVELDGGVLIGAAEAPRFTPIWRGRV